MQKKQLMFRKPAYRHGQLLLEDDFIDEQTFHLRARQLHDREMHGFGIVRGLEVTQAGDLALTVAPGFAVDRMGHELELREAETLELRGLPAGAMAWVTLGYRTESFAQAQGSDNRIDCYAQLRVATGVEPGDIRLCAIQIDERGRITPQSILLQDQRDAQRALVARASVTAESLDASLRRDWVTMAFHPSPMPQDENDARPPFRVGATQAVSHKEYDGKPNARGAAGTMTIVLPPGVRYMHRFRVAGAIAEHKLTATLIRGGFSEKEMKHLRDEVLTLETKGGGGYFLTGTIPDAHRELNDRRRTLGVDIRSHGQAGVSLVALDVSY